MIRVVMLGRTANNLFQYALGRVLAERHGVPLVMDASWFNNRTWAPVSCISRLPIRAHIARPMSLASRVLLKLVNKHHWEFRGVPVLKEAPGDQTFDARFLAAPRSCVLMGYFQSPRYFAGMEEALRRDLAMDQLPWPDATRRMAEQFAASNSVAVHVRRDDYLRKVHLNVCGLAYYRRAMDRLRECHPGLRFHIFSDDPAWCQENLGADDARVCALPEASGDPLHDLYLMSRARHHIIANSSYSWWAAWLGKSAGQEVLMPSVWFNGGIIAPIEEKRCEGWEIVDVD